MQLRWIFHVNCICNLENEKDSWRPSCDSCMLLLETRVKLNLQDSKYFLFHLACMILQKLMGLSTNDQTFYIHAKERNVRQLWYIIKKSTLLSLIVRGLFDRGSRKWIFVKKFLIERRYLIDLGVNFMSLIVMIIQTIHK